MYTLIFDGGNSLIKAKTTSGEVAFPHALQEITKAEYEQILTRAGQRGPGFDAGRDAVEDDAGVIEEILDGGAEVHRGGGVAACPVVVLVAQPRHPTFRHGAPFITPAGIR